MSAMFIDRAEIVVNAGDGGDGCTAFRREKYVPFGGPAGGDGGRGGHVYMEAALGMNSLIHFKYNPEYRAGRGGHGEGNNRHGRDGEDIVIRVPVGTLVYDQETGELIHDFSTPGERVLIARGGRGGRGTARFAPPDAPRAAISRARAAGSGPPPAIGAEASGRCRAGRFPQRGQVHVAGAHLSGAAEDRRISFHHAGTRPRRRAT